MTSPDFAKYKVVSFDVFDTLVTRLLSKPKDVFSVVELRAGRAGIPSSGFAQARVMAEREARARGEAEITLDGIYACLSRPVGEEPIAERLKEIELQVERDVCVPSCEGRTLWRAALESGVPVVITSDMYLRRAFIEELLASCGYEGWAACFVSCERGATKASGMLYNIVANEMGVAPAEIIHIGDNTKSDVLRARKAGLAVVKVHTAHPDAHDLVESFVLGSGNAHGRSVADGLELGLEDLGYRALGPVVVGFCQWLEEEVTREGIDKVFYLARDGLVVQRTMLALGKENMYGRYLYASRRALQVPSFALLEGFSDIVRSMFLPRAISLRALFEKMGLDGDLTGTRMQEIGIDPDVKRLSVNLEDDVDVLRAYEEFKLDVKENAQQELGLLEAYLRQEGFEGRVALVDIGWYGNMQVALERVCRHMGLDVEVHGYYVGLSPYGKNQTKHDMRGYLFDADHGLRLFEQEHCYNLMFETLFSATHGTTHGYCMVGSRIDPVLADYRGVEAEVGYEAEQARRGALWFARDWTKVLGSETVLVRPELALHELSRVGIEPTLAEARHFGDWAMEADAEIVSAAKPKRLGYYVAHPKDLIGDFSDTSWKVGFLKRLLKLPFPYGRAWICLHTAYKRRH